MSRDTMYFTYILVCPPSQVAIESTPASMTATGDPKLDLHHRENGGTLAV